MTARNVTVGLVQMRCDGSPQQNLARALSGVADAARAGARLVALPELFLGPYFCQRPDDQSAFERAEPVPGPTTQALADAARRHAVVLVGGSVFERAGGDYYNTALLFGPDGALTGTYRKTHIPEDVLYHEKHYFKPGDTGVRVFATNLARVAPLICYDQWYPEAARLATLQGAELLVYPTAIGLIDEQVEANITGDWETMWRSAQVGHAAANNVFVAAVNRVGREGAITFWGGSFVAGPTGEVLKKGGAGEEIVLAECDLARVRPLQEAWRFLPNRRPEVYGLLAAGGKAGLAKAIALAAVAHAEQRDLEGRPYITHPLRVMQIVERLGGNELAQTVAVLHDTLEDTTLTADDLRAAGFGDAVIEAVRAVTHAKDEPYADYVVRIARHHVPRLVKLADLEDNSRIDRATLRAERVERDLHRVHRYLLSYKFLTGELSEDKYRELMARHGEKR